jgi:hypothetical protein
MTEGDKLLAAILEQPKDTARRLVYADYSGTACYGDFFSPDAGAWGRSARRSASNS